MDVVALGERRTNDDRQQPRFLGVNTGARAARLAIEADDTSFKAALQSLRHLDAGNAVAASLEFQHVGTNYFDALAPVVAHADRPAIVFQNFNRLIAKLAQFCGVGALESQLNTSALPGT